MNSLTRFIGLSVFLFFTTNLHAQEPGRSDSLDVLKYNIHLNILDFTNKTIDGYTEIKSTFKMSNISKANFDLLALSVDSVYINNIKTTSYAYNDTLLSIHLGTTVDQSDTLDFTIFYHGAPVIDPSTWGGFYYTSSMAYNLGVGFESLPHNFGRVWFPCIDEFRDKAYYDFYITTLNNHTAVCGGSLIGSITNPNSTKTWHWKLRDPIPTYLASVAVSEYSVVNMPLIHGLDTTQATIYVAAADTTRARNSFVHLNQIFNGYINAWGPYKWERVGYVSVPFNAGAMEHATNIAYPTLAIDGTLNNENLFGHELAHSWFGNLITCATAEDMWINEGWARYSEAIYKGVLYPNINPKLDGYKSEIRNLQFKTFRNAYVNDGAHFALYPMPQNITYGTTTYDKGALIVHTLRYYIGDSLFFNSVRQLLAEYSFKSINSSEFCNRLSFYSGVNLVDFFNSWIYQPGYLHFSIDSLIPNQAQSNQYTYYIHQKHSMDLNLGNSNRVEVTFFDHLWNSYTDTIRFSGEFGSKTVNLPFIPVFSTIDYQEKMADAVADYHLTISTNGNNNCTEALATVVVNSITDSTMLCVEHHWAKPDPMKNPSLAIKRLSPNRYWRIDGIPSANFSARLNLSFGNVSDLDESLINGASSDSLVVLYRRDASQDWRMIPFSKAGTATGIIKIDTMLLGEYTFAIGDKSQIGISENLNQNSDFTILPNPNNGTFNLTSLSQEIEYYEILNPSGKLLLRINNSSQNKSQSISLKNGIYFIYSKNKKGDILKSKKMVISN